MPDQAQTNTTTTPDQPQKTSFRWIGTHSRRGDWETRHEAIGALARFGDPDTDVIAAISENCLGRLHEYPEHLGNKYYADRDRIATTLGVVTIDHEEVVRYRNGDRQETIDSHWEIQCPSCYRTHRSEDGSEEARSDVIDQMLACCDDVEWFAPSDWREDCGVCGQSHREKHGCEPPGHRDDPPSKNEQFRCTDCEWDGPGDDLQGIGGVCPTCESPAVVVVQ